jgi:hypothetical protein
MANTEQGTASVAGRVVLRESLHGIQGFSLTINGETISRVRSVTISSKMGQATTAVIEVLADDLLVDLDAIVVSQSLVPLSREERKVLAVWRRRLVKDCGPEEEAAYFGAPAKETPGE